MTPAAPSNSPPPRRRSATRLIAVQALYEMDVSGVDAETALEAILAKRWQGAEGTPDLPAPDEALLSRIAQGVGAHLTHLDQIIQPALTGTWTVDRLEVLLRAILRAGAFELMDNRPDVPPKVVINEYVNVAHAFYRGREPALVNAVLDRIAAARPTRPDIAAFAPASSTDDDAGAG